MANEIEYKINLDDLDFMGIVSHYNWIRLFERFRTQIYKEKYKRVLADKLGIVIAKLDVSYKIPAKYDETVKFKIFIAKSKTSSAIIRHEVYNSSDKLMVTGDLTLVCIDNYTRPIPFPHYFNDE